MARRVAGLDLVRGLHESGSPCTVDKRQKGHDHKIIKPKDTGIDAPKKALHLCLKRLKIAKDQTEIEHLTEELNGSSTNSTKMPKIKRLPPGLIEHRT